MAKTRNRTRVGRTALCGVSLMTMTALVGVSPTQARAGSDCSSPALAIPANNVVGVSDMMTVSASGFISDLDVYLNITQDWAGLLIVTLEHIETGTTVTLIDRPLFPALSGGCNHGGVDATLDDEAAGAVEDECAGGTPTILGTFIPNEALSAFDGEELYGTWQLTVRDGANGSPGTGMLVEWCLDWSIHDPGTLVDTGCGGLNLSFESGDFAGWSTQDIASPYFPLTVGPAGLFAGFGSSAPTDGSFAVVHGFEGDGPGVIRVAQDFAFPSGTSTLWFDYRAGWDLPLATIDRTFSVHIEPAGGGAPMQTDLILTAVAGTFYGSTGDLVGAVDVSAFAGSTVHVVFEWDIPESFAGPGLSQPSFFQLDNIRCLEDCNGNGTDDWDDIDNGTSADCDGNSIPDECEPDTDADGTIDTCDDCPNDASKTAPGTCGCGAADEDTDGDGVIDCDQGGVCGVGGAPGLLMAMPFTIFGLGRMKRSRRC